MPALIQDEFSRLRISPQQRWQLRKKKKGLCQSCGAKIPEKELKSYCLPCTIWRNERKRKARGVKRRYRSLSWRLLHHP